MSMQDPISDMLTRVRNALMAGGQLAGFTGVLLALPVAAVLLVFLKRMLGAYLETDVYNAGD